MSIKVEGGREDLQYKKNYITLDMSIREVEGARERGTLGRVLRCVRIKEREKEH